MPGAANVAAIDDKIEALSFQVWTQRAPEQILQLISDAAEMAAATGGKVAITQTGFRALWGISCA